jgi:hypothetical protein
MSVADAAVTVLREARRSMTVAEIYKAIRVKDL